MQLSPPTKLDICAHGAERQSCSYCTPRGDHSRTQTLGSILEGLTGGKMTMSLDARRALERKMRETLEREEA